MAFATRSGTRSQSGLGFRLDAFRGDLRTYLARRALFRRTLTELRALTDRELADLGLHRSELRRVAKQAVYDA